MTNPDTSAKEYWKITKELYGKKVHRGIPPIIINGKVYSSSEATCNICNKTFTAKSKLPEQKPVLPRNIKVTNQTLDLLATTHDEVHKIL